MAKGNSVLQSVNNALRVIEVLSEEESMGISEISRRLGIGKSTAYRLITTLSQRNFVTQNIVNEKYSLSIKFVEIGSKILARGSLIKIVHPYLKDLTKKYNETTHLVVMDNYQTVFIDKVNSNCNTIQMHSYIGTRMPAYCTGTGKALLAHLDQAELEEYLASVRMERFTDRTITEPEVMKKEMEKIRQQGYSEDNEEKERGLTCYAFPLINSLGHAVAAISISGPTERMQERREVLLASLGEASAEISRAIGWMGNRN